MKRPSRGLLVAAAFVLAAAQPKPLSAQGPKEERVAISVKGDVRVEGGGKVEPYRRLAPGDRLLLSAESALVLVGKEGTIRLVGPAAGSLGALLGQVRPRRKSSTLLGSAARALSEVLSGGRRQVRVGGVRGVPRDHQPTVWPPSGHLAPQLLPEEIEVRAAPHLVSGGSLVIESADQSTRLATDARSGRAKLSRSLLRPPSARLVLRAHGGALRPLATWRILPRDEQTVLASSLREAEEIHGGAREWPAALLRAAILAEKGCFYQAEMELRRWEAGEAAGPERSLASRLPWRSVVLEVVARWRESRGSAWRPLTTGARVPSGATIRLQPTASRVAQASVLARGADGGWMPPLPPTGFQQKLLPMTPIDLVLDDQPGREAILVSVSVPGVGNLDRAPGEETVRLARRAGQLPTPDESFVAHGFGRAWILLELEHVAATGRGKAQVPR